MTVTVTEGPVARTDWSGTEKFDCSFRLVTAYHIGTDSEITRLDVLMKVPEELTGTRYLEKGIRPGVQFNVALTTSKPGESDLQTPKAGITGCIALKVSAQQLAAAFRRLADRIEKELAT